MKRRQFISLFMGVTALTLAPNNSLFSRKLSTVERLVALAAEGNDEPSRYLSLLDPVIDREQPITIEDIAALSRVDGESMDSRDAYTMKDGAKKEPANNPESKVERNHKNVDFARNYDDDIYVTESELPLLQSVAARLQRTQKTMGYGHFNVVSFDDVLTFSKRYSTIGHFTKAELDFVEQLFSTNAALYGFYGEKVNDRLTGKIKPSDITKIPGSGHYIFKGDSLAHYEKLKKDIGSSIILTSGIRSNVKQLYLFLAKTIQVDGNLSRASRSLAPPGYSYHGIGDFDVGKIGWGEKNFTDDFATTDEFKKMQDLGYIAIRYDHGNNLGVRFEPWHIKVV